MAAPTYGPLETIREIDIPLPEPSAREVRVRVVASALNPADFKVVTGTLKFLHARTKPLVVGYDFSGVVEAIGPNAGFGVRDEVFGFLPYSPGNKRGAFAERLVARADEIAKKPASVTHERAAASATTGVTAIQAIRDLGRLPEGGRVVITGVSGGVGSIAIGVAKKLGAHVTAVGSGSGLELARKLGADDVVDRTKAKLPDDLRERHHVIFDASAAYRWREWRRALEPKGMFVSTLPSAGLFADKIASVLSSTGVTFVNVKSRPSDLALLASWLEEGLEVPLASTISVSEVAQGLAHLQKSGGRVLVRVADGWS